MILDILCVVTGVSLYVLIQAIRSDKHEQDR